MITRSKSSELSAKKRAVDKTVSQRIEVPSGYFIAQGGAIIPSMNLVLDHGSEEKIATSLGCL